MKEEEILARISSRFNVWLTITDSQGKEHRILGRGKAQLLRAVRDTGSIRAASEEIPLTRGKRISFRTAWKKIHRIEEQLDEAFGTKGLKVILSERGGAERGGSSLTPLGDALLRRFEEAEEQVARALATLCG